MGKHATGCHRERAGIQQSGPGHSILTTLLVNETLKFKNYTQITTFFGPTKMSLVNETLKFKYQTEKTIIFLPNFLLTFFPQKKY